MTIISLNNNNNLISVKVMSWMALVQDSNNWRAPCYHSIQPSGSMGQRVYYEAVRQWSSLFALGSIGDEIRIERVTGLDKIVIFLQLQSRFPPKIFYPHNPCHLHGTIHFTTQLSASLSCPHSTPGMDLTQDSGAGGVKVNTLK